MRTELWHPLIVHWPIVALLLGTLFSIAGFFIKAKGWRYAISALLVIGVVGAWAAFITGEWADGEVARNLCDPTVLKAHENAAFTCNIFFSIGTGLQLLNYFNLVFLPPKLVHFIVAIILCIGSYFLYKTGHLGAELVYEQAAGVQVPSENCSEFE